MISLQSDISEVQRQIPKYESDRSESRASKINAIFHEIFYDFDVFYVLPPDPNDAKALHQSVITWKQLRPTDVKAIEWFNIMQNKEGRIILTID